MTEGRSKTKLTWRTKICYACGHILNDLCASMWFTYLLVYLHKVVGFSNTNAGTLMLIGQLADAVATPLVGIESDRTTGCSYGRRKVWHLVGVVSVAVSFPFVFNLCFGCENSSERAKFVYYTPFVVVFQFGWAATQIAHLATIPELTDDDQERMTLNALRYSGTVISNIAVFLATWMFLDTEMSETDSRKLNTADSTAFTYVVGIVMSIGLLFTVIFHLGIKERPRNCTHELATRSSKRSASNWTMWFKEPRFYKVGVLYMCVRLAINVTQCYMPMYTIETLKLNKVAIATMPLVVYVSGFMSTFAARITNGYFDRKITLLLGLLVMLITSVWMWYLPPHSSQIYGASVTLGVGGSTLLVTVMTMLAALIGENVETGAFVYGAMSFLDKVSNGIAVQLIQVGYPRRQSSAAHPGEKYYRLVMVLVIGGSTLVAFLCLLSLARWKFERVPGASGVEDSSRRSLLGGSDGSAPDNTLSWSLLCAPAAPPLVYRPGHRPQYGGVDQCATRDSPEDPGSVDESAL